MTHALGAARQAHSARCRQRVIKALNDSIAAGEEISVSAIARRAGVNRSFLYNHRDLHATILAKAAEPPSTPTGGPAVSRASLIADLGNAHDRIARLTTENQHLRNRLSEALGEQIWKETGLGGPTDIQQLQRRITELDQQAVELRRQFSDRASELDAACAANRELMARLNKPITNHPEHS
jgi:regulator of replication initiation timing